MGVVYASRAVYCIRAYASGAVYCMGVYTSVAVCNFNYPLPMLTLWGPGKARIMVSIIWQKPELMCPSSWWGEPMNLEDWGKGLRAGTWALGRRNDQEARHTSAGRDPVNKGQQNWLYTLAKSSKREQGVPIAGLDTPVWRAVVLT